jgi:hypothetical protein
MNKIHTPEFCLPFLVKWQTLADVSSHCFKITYLEVHKGQTWVNILMKKRPMTSTEQRTADWSWPVDDGEATAN